MKKPTFIAGLVAVCLAAVAGVSVAAEQFTTIHTYIVNFAWQTPAGVKAYPQFTAPNSQTVFYEPVTVPAGGATCFELGSSTLNSTDQIIWYKLTSGTWAKLADDVANVRDPHAVIYSDGSIQLETRLADYYASSPGWLQVRTQHVSPHPTWPAYESRCDDWAAWRGWPYLKVKGGVITAGNVR